MNARCFKSEERILYHLHEHTRTGMRYSVRKVRLLAGVWSQTCLTVEYTCTKVRAGIMWDKTCVSMKMRIGI
jgi:hypothetical protein